MADRLELPGEASARRVTPPERLATTWLPLDAGVAERWERLANVVGAPPWLRPGWFSLWSDAFGGGDVSVLAVSRGGEQTGFVPLLRRGRLLRSPSNWHTEQFGAVAADTASTLALAKALVEERARRLDLAFVDPGTPLYDGIVAAASERRSVVLARVLERSPFLEVEGDWDEYERSLPRKLTAEGGALRRHLHKLETVAPVRLEVHDGTAELEPLLEDAFRIEAAGWKGERGTAMASQPVTRLFYSELARWGSRRGWLRLAFLRVGETRVATDLAFETGGVHFLLKTGYDPAYRRYGPGILLRHAMIERAFELGLDRYEFLGGDEPWKRAWTSTTHERRRLQVFAPDPAGRSEWLAFRYGRPLAKAVVERVRS